MHAVKSIDYIKILKVLLKLFVSMDLIHNYIVLLVIVTYLSYTHLCNANALPTLLFYSIYYMYYTASRGVSVTEKMPSFFAKQFPNSYNTILQTQDSS